MTAPTDSDPRDESALSNGTLMEQIMKFGVVGILGFITDVGGFNLLRYAGGHGPLHDYALTAKIISGVAATVVAWLGNRYWTFKHSRRQAAHHEFALFAVVAAVGILIAAACLWFSHHVLHLTSPLADNISANGVGLGLAMVFRFWAYRAHVFSDHGDGTGLSDIAEYVEQHDPGHAPGHSSGRGADSSGRGADSSGRGADSSSAR